MYFLNLFLLNTIISVNDENKSFENLQISA